MIRLVEASIYPCPPKPGSTLITKTKSILSKKGSISEIGVDGFKEIPTLLPVDLIKSIMLNGSSAASI